MVFTVFTVCGVLLRGISVRTLVIGGFFDILSMMGFCKKSLFAEPLSLIVELLEKSGIIT